METSPKITIFLISGFVWTRDAFVIIKRRETIIGGIVDFPPSARADSRCG